MSLDGIRCRLDMARWYFDRHPELTPRVTGTSDAAKDYNDLEFCWNDFGLTALSHGVSRMIAWDVVEAEYPY